MRSARSARGDLPGRGVGPERSRHVEWDGFLNARDLGGLPTRDGRTTRRGSDVRSEHPSHLSAAGWRQLRSSGVRTLVSLTTEGIDDGARAPVVRDLSAGDDPGVDGTTRRVVAVEDGRDAAFLARWAADPAAAALDGGLLATPLYWTDAVTRWPDRCAAAVAAVADAPAGGVLLHCGRGCDRTGLVTALLLTLAGVAPEHVAADYALSAGCLRPRSPDHPEQLERVLSVHGTDVLSSVCGQLAALDVESCLRGGGLTDAQVRGARRRLLGPA